MKYYFQRPADEVLKTPSKITPKARHTWSEWGRLPIHSFKPDNTGESKVLNKSSTAAEFEIWNRRAWDFGLWSRCSLIAVPTESGKSIIMKGRRGVLFFNFFNFFLALEVSSTWVKNNIVNLNRISLTGIKLTYQVVPVFQKRKT